MQTQSLFFRNVYTETVVVTASMAKYVGTVSPSSAADIGFGRWGEGHSSTTDQDHTL